MREKVVELRSRSRDRYSLNPSKGIEVGRAPTSKEQENLAFCRSCVNLLYLSGTLRCAEFKFLLAPADIQAPIDCPKYMPLEKIKSFKIFTGVANKMAVMEELVHEAVIRATLTANRGATLLEVAGFIGSSKKTAYRILERLERQGHVFVSTIVLNVPGLKGRKIWRVNVYWPKILEGKINAVKDG